MPEHTPVQTTCTAFHASSPLLQRLPAHITQPAAQGSDLQYILRQSYNYLTIMLKPRSTYDRHLIYKTSYNEWKAFHRYDSRAKS